VRTAEHAGRELHIAARERAADRGAADRLLDAVEPLDELDRLDDEVVRPPVLLEQPHVPLPVTSEVEVLSDHDDLDREVPDQHPFDERLRRLLGLRLVEVEDHGGVDAGCSEQFEPLLGTGQQLGGRLRAHDLGRMAIEREHHGERSRVGGELLHPLDDGQVPQVHAVVRANRHHRALAGEGGPIEIRDDLHGRRR
jgi:hypothetical protein